MSLVTSTFANPNFTVRTSGTASNKTRPLTVGKVIKQSVGATSSAVPVSALLNHTITVVPTTANQTFTLPTAAQLLSQFGKSTDTGVPKLAAGDSLVFNVVNRGSQAAYIASNPTGGDGTAIIAYTGASAQVSGAAFTGAVAPVGKITPVYLEWLQVSGGVVGATGLYTLYA